MLVQLGRYERGFYASPSVDGIPEGGLVRSLGKARVETGTWRSRWGLLEERTLAEKVFSVYEFAGVRFASTALEVFRAGVSLYTLGFEERLAFVRMAAKEGGADSLFIAGGGRVRRVNQAGTVSRWGIEAPTGGTPTATAVADAVLETPLPVGDYLINFTYVNQTDGFESNPHPDGPFGPVTIGPNEVVEFSGMPNSPDAQVTHKAIYATDTNGVVLFFVGLVANSLGTVRYVETRSSPAANVVRRVKMDTARPERFDRGPPDDDWSDAVGPFFNRVFWGRVSTAGQGGKVYFSRPGEPTAVEDVIDVSSEDDPVEKLVIFQGRLFAFTREWIIEIVPAGNFFISRKIARPGTPAPFTVASSPVGVFYQAVDGLRMFDGARSVLIGFEALGRLFRGERVGEHEPFFGVVGCYGRGEYLITDEARLLGYDPQTQAFREVMPLVSAIYAEHDADVIQIGRPSGLIGLLETVGAEDDAGECIPITLETRALRGPLGQALFIQEVYLDIDTRANALTLDLIIDGFKVIALAPVLFTLSRANLVFPVYRRAMTVGVRLRGQVQGVVEVFDMAVRARPGGVDDA